MVATAFLRASVCIARREKKEVSKLWQMHGTFSSCSGSCRGWLSTLAAKGLEAGTLSAQAAKMRKGQGFSPDMRERRKRPLLPSLPDTQLAKSHSMGVYRM